MKVCVRPVMVGDRPLAVVNPRTGRPFPQGVIFTLQDLDAKHPRVRQLFPRSVAGGRDGDLLPAEALTKAERDALKDIADLLTPAAATAAPSGGGKSIDKSASQET